MLGKLLLTAVVIISALWYLRARPQSYQPPVQMVKRRKLRWIWVVVVVLFAVSAGLLYVQYRQGQKVVEVKVINTYTGQVTVYFARQGDLSNNHFVTLDGRTITLATIERLEVLPKR